MTTRIDPQAESDGVTQQRWLYLVSDDNQCVVELHYILAPDNVNFTIHSYSAIPGQPLGVNGPLDGYQWFGGSVGAIDAYNQWQCNDHDDEVLWKRMELELTAACERSTRTNDIAALIAEQYKGVDLNALKSALSSVTVGE